jgi:hypothetical protein
MAVRDAASVCGGVNRTVLVGGGLGTVGLALLGLGTAGVLAGVATTLWLAWWERRKELAVASGRFVWDRDATFGVREVEAGPEPDEAEEWPPAGTVLL